MESGKLKMENEIKDSRRAAERQRAQSETCATDCPDKGKDLLCVRVGLKKREATDEK